MRIKKNKKKIQIGVVTSLIILIIIAMIISLFLSAMGVNSQQVSINNGLLESTLVSAQNIFSIDGIKFVIGNAVSNFRIFEPLVVLIISIICVSILESSGLLNYVFSRFGKLKTWIITFLTVLISILFVFFGENAYLFLIPLVAAIYKEMGRNPIVGIVSVFLGVTLGYGSGIILNSDGYILGLLTEQAATLDVDPTYKFNMFSINYIMVIGGALLAFVLTLFIEKNISSKVRKHERTENTYINSKKGLIISSIILGVFVFLSILIILPNSVFLDQTQHTYMLKLFGEKSIIGDSFIYIILIFMIIIGFVYGKISKNFNSDIEANLGLSSQFENIGFIFVVMFFISQLLGILNYTNINTIVVSGITNLLSAMDFSGMFLIITFMIIVVIITLLIPSLIDKWVLMSPTIVPLFMRANITPEFCQYLYVVSNSIGKCVTPLFVYFLVMISFLQKYNTEEKQISIGSVIRLIMPTVLCTVTIMILFILLWYISGIPVGVGGYPIL